MKRIVNLLHKNLSYRIQGIAFDIRKNFGLGHKEQIYQKAFEEELKRIKISYEREKAIKIYSPKDGKFIGLYRPDFIIDKKIVVELKTFKFVPKDEMRKIYDYLRNSKYELGYLINFASPELYVKRIIFTNDKKDWFKKLLVFVSLILVLLSGLPSIVNAAILYLDPSQGNYCQGDTFIEEVRLDTQGEEINAGEINLKYPQNILEVEDISTGNSIFSLWIKRPEVSVSSCGEANVSCSLVSFAGGVPNGFNDDGLIGKIVFKVREIETDPEGEPSVPYGSSAKLEFLEGTRLLLNDGKGTEAELTTKEAILEIKAKRIGEAENQWQDEIKNDKNPPELFKIEIARTPQMFEGKYFIVFNTSDKESGIDRYEVAELARTIRRTTPNWKKGDSPYLLEDQSLKSIIKVKAVDKAGNERIAEYNPLIITKKITKETIIIFFIIIGSIIIGCIVKKYLRIKVSMNNPLK